GNWKLLYEEQADLQPMSMVGYMPDMSGLIVHVRSDDEGVDEYKLISFDGNISAFDFEAPGSGSKFIITDQSRKMIGSGTTGLRRTRKYHDAQLTEVMNSIAARFPNDAVGLVDWTDDWNQLVVSIEGGATAPAYFLADRTSGAFGKLAPQYLRISDSDVASVDLIEYAARDGLKIPTVLTRPRGSAKGSKLPLIVIPHGGPVAYDSLGFDYWAQFFASRGYLVLQPNFRGSAGFGADFRRAGYGEWGAKMQDDITDGVNHLIDAGWADPDRVCIVGGSYGGYAALAGGAFTPDLYKCVVAIAPVSDIPTMLEHESRVTGRYSGTSDYWKMVIGDRSSDRAKLEAISPARNARNFKAPVLLIHGTDDTVVPYNQSARMEDALRSSGKNVKLVQLKAEDHWLSSSATRLQTFKEMDAFVTEHIGPAN
ncbi:MAG: prolyl oligopeptidase family serine peptidase, partial [Amphiplicatus sp.]